MKYNKRNLVISIVALALGLAGFALLLVFYIQSYSAEDDIWEMSNGNTMYGLEVSSKMDYAIGMIVALVVIIFGFYVLSKTFAAKDINKVSYLATGSVITAILGFYFFQAFFKPLIKCVVKGEKFVYTDYHVYLYLSIVFLIAFIVFIVFDIKAYLNQKKSL